MRGHTFGYNIDIYTTKQKKIRRKMVWLNYFSKQLLSMTVFDFDSTFWVAVPDVHLRGSHNNS